MVWWGQTIVCREQTIERCIVGPHSFLAYASILQVLLPLFLFAENRELTIFVLIYTLMIHRLPLYHYGQAFMPRSAGPGKYRDNGKKRRDPDDEAVLRPQGQTS